MLGLTGLMKRFYGSHFKAYFKLILCIILKLKSDTSRFDLEKFSKLAKENYIISELIPAYMTMTQKKTLIHHFKTIKL